MTRVMVSVFGVLVTVVALGVPARGAVTAPVPPEDFVVGGGEGGIFSDISIDAHSDPLGGNASGTVSFRFRFPPFPPVLVSGPVHCLAVDGTRAVIGVVPLGSRSLIKVVVSDNGSAGSPPDGFAFFFVDPGGPDCSAFLHIDPPPLSSGNIVVRDAPTKAQCLDGGWHHYTDVAGNPFSSQGRCIAFALGAG
jgi:hypothetical protein